MERSIDQLPVDLLLQQLTYLPFEDVIAVCQSNSKLHSYCSDPKYNNKWRQLIDTTFSSVYDYQNKLKNIWSKLNLSEGTYNYVIYTKLIDLLDPLTQLMIYYKQGDTKSFRDNRFTDDQRFLSMFLLNKPDEMQKYDPKLFDRRPYYILLQGKTPTIENLNNMFIMMVLNGNMRGVKYMVEKGVNIHIHNRINDALKSSITKGHLDVVKYLVEQGADINARNNHTLIWASQNGHLDVVKYLVEQGVNINEGDDAALMWAIEKGHINVVKYLIEQGADIHAQREWALIGASTYGHLDVVKYLVEHGADIHSGNDAALIRASRSGRIDVVKYLVEQGANIHAGNDIALKWARSVGHLDVVKYLQNYYRLA